VLIRNLIIAANGPNLIAAQYGAFLMKHLNVFNTIKVVSGDNIKDKDLEKLKYGGYLSLTQSGDQKNMINGVIKATKLGVTCINVVNVEDSPITRVI